MNIPDNISWPDKSSSSASSADIYLRDASLSNKPRSLRSIHTTTRKSFKVGAAFLLICALTLTGCANVQNGTATNGSSASSTSERFTSAADYINQNTAAFIFDSDGEYNDMNYISNGNDENAVRVKDAYITMTDCIINKRSGDTSNANASLEYGLNAGVLAAESANLEMERTDVVTTGTGSCAIIGYGVGTQIQASDAVIATTRDDSSGLRVADNASMSAENMGVSTRGEKSVAIGIERGGGRIDATGGTYTTSGVNSPAIFTAGELAMTDASLSAVMSPAIMIGSGGSLDAVNCLIDGNTNPEGAFTGSDAHAVALFGEGREAARARNKTFTGNPLGQIQHMAISNSAAQLNIEGGTLTSYNGSMFYVTNTAAQITLENVKLNLIRSGIVATAQDEVLLRVCGNDGSFGWGTPGNNGAVLSLIAKNQELSGDIVVDSISSLALRFENGSDFEGSVNAITYKNKYGGEGAVGNGNNSDGDEAATDANSNDTTNAHYIYVEVGAGCTWNLTGNCTLDALVNNGTINFNGFTITLSDGTVLQ